DMLLQETGYKADPNKRLRVFLTNSLEEAPDKNSIIPFARWLSDEANEASSVKRDTPVMVVLGNPPYSGESANKGKWIESLMRDYKKEPTGETLQERNSKWINDDYAKFIRYGQHFIEKNGEGILAYVNNHSFLDNPTFRGMRWSLLQTFDKIYILDLHGNTRKKEVAPDGDQDENVFDIQQGVSINIFVKTEKKKTGNLARVFHYDLYGERNDKYSFLLNNSLTSVEWHELQLKAPQYFFVAKDFKNQEEYENGFSIQELFPVNSVGVVTARDFVFINDDKDILDKNIKNSFGINPDKELIHGISYRPFDNQFVYYDIKKLERPRENVMQHFLKGENIGLVIGRQGQVVGSMLWNLAFVTSQITDFNLYYRGGGMIFPLYLYSQPDQLFAEEKREPNLNIHIVNEIAQRIGLQYTEEKESTENTFAPIDILDYIYAVLHSPAYREQYKEFLKIDFPRVPYPQDAAQFRALAVFGAKLRQLHLLEGVEPLKDMATYPKEGSNEVERLNYADGKLWINNVQYFEYVPHEVWEFYIGGYQPAQKWLKDRKGRQLGYEDIRHYQKMIRALWETSEIQKELNGYFQKE
ncbi:hypothetical protein EZS27_004139, partial [termite gut metagenome]